MAFKIAGSLGFKSAVEKAKPVILEPIMNMEITVPDESMGDVIGDLNSRRGKVVGMDTKGHNQVIKSKVPMSEVLKYAPDLRASPAGENSRWSFPTMRVAAASGGKGDQGSQSKTSGERRTQGLRN